MDLIEEAIKLESDLIRINSVNPSFGGKGEKRKGRIRQEKVNGIRWKLQYRKLHFKGI